MSVVHRHKCMLQPLTVKVRSKITELQRVEEKVGRSKTLIVMGKSNAGVGRNAVGQCPM